MCLEFGQFYKNVVLRLSEHGDVIEMQTIRFSPQSILANSVPAHIYIYIQYIFANKVKTFNRNVITERVPLGKMFACLQKTGKIQDGVGTYLLSRAA